jgi:membrane protein YqaA with SNARE-associated domain
MVGNLWISVPAYYGLAVVSAVVPWMNAEVLMLSAVPVAGSRPALGALVMAVAAGQMTGKAAAYWVSRTSARPRSPRLQRVLDTWHARFEQRPASALVVTFVSALIGIPPFFLVSMAAGSLKVAFGRFMAVGSVGRLIHFGLVAFLPELLRRTS